MIQTLLQQALKRNDIRLLDLHIGKFLEKKGSNRPHPELLLAGTLASAAVGHGHVCQPLDQVTNLPFIADSSLLPDTDRWRTSLLATPVVGRPGDLSPLILDEKNRLYLYRFYQYEASVARDLLARASQTRKIETEHARRLLNRLFPRQDAGDQQLAVAMAQITSFLVISGGPGTGKTYTVSRILALAQALADDPLRIGLAAPTGKAAARMDESLRLAKQSLPAEIASAIPEQAHTLHRLLGYRPDSDTFYHNRHNPLRCDLLIVDEASMIDLPLMNALLQALPTTTRLILLGDRHQLASVEAGSLFSDLCQKTRASWSDSFCKKLNNLTGRDDLSGTSPAESMAERVVQLNTSYRFQDTSGIGALSAAVNSGKTERLHRTLAMDFPDLEVVYLTGKDREHWLSVKLIENFEQIFLATTLEQAFTAMEQFRCLCAVRKGPSGVENVNALIQKTLREKGCIAQETDLYPGKPIIIRRNHYGMKLFNGDTGLLWNDREGKLRAWFKRADNSLFPIAPARLPAHDTAWAITIHKAQGSEFTGVLLLLPEEESQVLSRELLYTGITRARNSLALCSSREILEHAVRKKTCRYSGLADKLWPGPGETTTKS